jgi:hypothetical protein
MPPLLPLPSPQPEAAKAAANTIQPTVVRMAAQ